VSTPIAAYNRLKRGLIMAKQILAGLVIWTAIVVYYVGPSEPSVAAAQTVHPEAIASVPAPHPIVPRIGPETTVDQQMSALDRHARFNMILYPGRLGQGDSAELNRELRAIALALEIARARRASPAH
jgi:hypothetical protein